MQILAVPQSRSVPAEVRRVLGERRVSGKLLDPGAKLRLGRGIACDRDAGLLYAVDGGGGGPGASCLRKLKLHSADGELLLASSAEMELSAPAGIALSADGQLLVVADAGKHCLFLFDAPSLRYLRTLGGKGSARGQLRAPDGVCVHEGSVYVADTHNHRVCAFLLDGGAASVTDRVLRAAIHPGGCEKILGCFGSDPGLFEFPRGVATCHGWLLVSEPQRVQLLTLEGAPLQVLPVPGARVLRGLCTDGWKAFVVDSAAHLVHVLNIDLLHAPHAAQASAQGGLTPKEPSPPAGWTSRVDDGHLEDAHRRIKAFMASHDVRFNGAGEAELESKGIAQAWSIAHLEPHIQQANLDTIKGVAAILQEYPSLHCEVHGETGKAREAPEPLASHFGLNATEHVGTIMEKLALLRAKACLDALVAEGVPAAQLHTSSTGMGGSVHVDFVPIRAASTRNGAPPSAPPSAPPNAAAAFLGGASSPPRATLAPSSVMDTLGAFASAPSASALATAPPTGATAGGDFLSFLDGGSAQAKPKVAFAGGPPQTESVSHFAAASPARAGQVGRHSIEGGARGFPPPIMAQPSTASSAGVEYVGPASASGSSVNAFLAGL